MVFFGFFLSLFLQCKFANTTLLSLLSFSYFITPYDAQASSAFSALININNHHKLSQICSYGILVLGTQGGNSRGKRAISVRAIKVLLYKQLTVKSCNGENLIFII